MLLRATSLASKAALLIAGLMLAGCMQATTFEAASESNMTPRDKELLAKARYAKVQLPEPYRRAIVNYHRKEQPGTIVVDSDNHYLYYVMENGKAIRYGVTVGEEALAFSGIAKVGNKQEWPRWTPTADIHKRISGLPAQLAGGPDNPLGARGIYLFQGPKDTLFRIHGTNQPEYIGASISSGCIRMTNEDVIDLYNRVKVGTLVVVLAPNQGDSPENPKIALQGGQQRFLYHVFGLAFITQLLQGITQQVGAMLRQCCVIQCHGAGIRSTGFLDRAQCGVAARAESGPDL